MSERTELKNIGIIGKRNNDALFVPKEYRIKTDNIFNKIGDIYHTNKKQIESINIIFMDELLNTENKLIKTELIKKLRGYKYQDIKKKKYDELNFITIDNLIEMLVICKLKCVYCKFDTELIYSTVRSKKQWTLDRIDNSYGHNNDNVKISCLKCNLDRRDINQTKFIFSKGLTITKLI